MSKPATKNTVAIGPEMPDVPTVSADEQSVETTPAPATVETERVVDAFGNIVETIVSVATAKNESPEERTARALTSYVDVNGFIVETY